MENNSVDRITVLGRGEVILTQKEAQQMVDSSMEQIKLQQHLNHPFYKKVDEITAEVAKGQILKGAEKYDEPFNPKSWTGREKAIHLLQELRDAQVYGVGMLEHIEELEEEVERLKSEIENLNFSRQGLSHTKDMLSKDNKNLRKDNGDLKNDIDDLMTKYKALKEEKEKIFSPTITVNLNGNVDPDFDGAKVAEVLAEQIKKGLSNL